jgi:hypothetical protein
MKGKKLLKKQHKKIPRLEIPQILASYWGIPDPLKP